MTSKPSLFGSLKFPLNDSIRAVISGPIVPSGLSVVVIISFCSRKASLRKFVTIENRSIVIRRASFPLYKKKNYQKKTQNVFSTYNSFDNIT